MEGRGAIFGPGEVEGVPIQAQARTGLTGYAISYGFDGNLLLLGTSPDIIGQGVAARHDGQGLVETGAFQTILKALSGRPTFFAYLGDEALIDLARTNMTAEEYQNRSDLVGLEAFEAIGLGLRLRPNRFDGVLYFLVPE
jgi:hypothetical protein